MSDLTPITRENEPTLGDLIALVNEAASRMNAIYDALMDCISNGSLSYEALADLPSIAGTALTGNKTLQDLGIISRTDAQVRDLAASVCVPQDTQELQEIEDIKDSHILVLHDPESGKCAPVTISKFRELLAPVGLQ